MNSAHNIMCNDDALTLDVNSNAAAAVANDKWNWKRFRRQHCTRSRNRRIRELIRNSTVFLFAVYFTNGLFFFFVSERNMWIYCPVAYNAWLFIMTLIVLWFACEIRKLNIYCSGVAWTRRPHCSSYKQKGRETRVVKQKRKRIIQKKEN